MSHAPTERLAAAGIAAITLVASPDGVVAACRALCRGGVRAVESTLTVPGAQSGDLDVVTSAARRFARITAEIRGAW